MSLAQKIDNFFSQRKQSEKILIYTSIFILVLAIAYQYLMPISEDFLRRAKSQKQQIETKLNMDMAYLNAMKVNGDQEYYVKYYAKEIAQQKELFKKIADKKAYLDHKIKELSYLLYNKRKWAEFLNSITHKAAKNGVDVDYIANNFLDITKEFGHVLEIEVGCNGDFHGLVGFLNDIEQSDLVVDIYALRMVGANPTQLQFKVSVWGISF